MNHSDPKQSPAPANGREDISNWVDAVGELPTDLPGDADATPLPSPAPAESTVTVLVAMAANAVLAATKSGIALVTGSPSLVAESAHSWADTGNEALLLVAQRRSQRPADARHPGGHGREAYVWSLLAAYGLFAAGAAVSVMRGLQELLHPSVAQHLTLAYLVLAVAIVLEGLSFIQSWRQGRQEASRADRDLLEHMLATSDPTLRAVFAEDAAALIGLAIALGAVLTRQLTGSTLPDAIGSLLVGALLAGVSVLLMDRNRRFLVGEAVDPNLRRAALAELRRVAPDLTVSYLHLEYSGPRQIALLARVHGRSHLPHHQVSAAISELERRIEARPGISRAVLAYSGPGDPALQW